MAGIRPDLTKLILFREPQRGSFCIGIRVEKKKCDIIDAFDLFIACLFGVGLLCSLAHV